MGLYRIYPKAHFCTAVFGHGSGYHTAKNVWGESVGSDCAASADESPDALDETNYGFIRSTAVGSYNGGRFEYSFGPPPSSITISRVRIVAYLRTSSGNNAAIDEAPRLKGFVNPAGTRYYQSGPSYFIMPGPGQVGGPVNRNTQGPTGTHARCVAGEWAVNPATGVAWTLTDLNQGVFKAGIECGGIAEGQAGNGLPPTTGGSAASLDNAAICIEIEATPSEVVTEPIRGLLSRLLWLRRRGVRPITLTVPLERVLDVGPGQTLYLDDPRFPTGAGSGISPRTWDARALFVIDRVEHPGSDVAVVKAWDQRDLAAALWSPLHTDVGADDVWNGLAWFDRGSGKAVTRAQGGWIHRPNDFYLRDVAAGKWRITPWGLAICGGSFSGGGFFPGMGELTWYPTYNTFSAGTGGEGTSLPLGDTTGFTGWTVGKPGTGTIVVKQDTSYLFDVSGCRRAVRLTSGTPYTAIDTGRIFQQLAGTFAATTQVRVCLLFRMVSGSPGDLQFVLRRSTAPSDWSQGSATWVSVGSLFNKCSDGVAIGGAELELVGDHYEYWSGPITIGGGGAETLTLFVISPASSGGSADVFGAAIVSTGAALFGAAAPVIRRSFLATTSAAAVQAADIVDVDNQDGYTVWDPNRGTLSLMFVPLWDHEDLADLNERFVVMAQHQAGVTDIEGLGYTRVDASSGYWRFFRIVSSVLSEAKFATSAAAGTLPRRWTPVRLSARWTSAEGELGLPAHTCSIFVDGKKGVEAVAAPSSKLVVGVKVALGRAVEGGPPSSFADGMLSNLDARLFCLTDDEIARLHDRMTLGNALPADV